MDASLQEFLSTLKATGELHQIDVEVSPILEVSAIADRVSKSPCAQPSQVAALFDPEHCDSGGKALLFKNIRDCDFTLAINVFGSYRRMEMALGCAENGGFEAIASRIASLVHPQPPSSLFAALRMGRQMLPVLRIGPRRMKRGRCQDIVKLTKRDEVDLSRLPLIKCWPLDGDLHSVGVNTDTQSWGRLADQGRYITFAGMHTIHADDRDAKTPQSHNIGMYRAQLLDETHLAMHWHLHHDGAAHWRSWKQLGQPMPIAICLGGESVLPYAATAPLPPGISELLIAGFLNGRGIEMVRAETVNLWVPANCEIVIEGLVSTECGIVDFDSQNGEPLGQGAALEGPFGDHTGYYSLPDRYPIMEVTAITHRKNAIYPTTIVGYPPQEDYYMGKATERIFLPLLKMIIPDIDDYHLPMFGCFHNCAFIRINKAYALHARRVMHAIWGAGQMAWTKMIVVVDVDVDVHDETTVLRAMFRHCDFKRDLEQVNGPLDILDHAAPRLGAGHKIGIDATRKWSGEEVRGVSVNPTTPTKPDPSAVDAMLRVLEARMPIVKAIAPTFGFGRCVFLSVEKTSPRLGAVAIDAAFDAASPGMADFVVAVDAEVDLNDTSAVMFHLCANSDPGRDLHRCGHRIGWDATKKLPGDERHHQPVRAFPPRMQMDENLCAEIDRRWSEYGFE